MAWCKGRNDERGFSITINRYRADHYNLNESLRRKGIIDIVGCECEAEKYLSHIIYRCRKFEEKRERVYTEEDDERE